MDIRVDRGSGSCGIHLEAPNAISKLRRLHLTKRSRETRVDCAVVSSILPMLLSELPT
jgi:hypothetical protein